MVGQSWEWLCARAIQQVSLVYSHQGGKKYKYYGQNTQEHSSRRFRFRRLERQQRDLCLPSITGSRWEGSLITSPVPLAQPLRSPLPSSNSALQPDYRNQEACLPSQPPVPIIGWTTWLFVPDLVGFFAAVSRSPTPSQTFRLGLSERNDISLPSIPPKLRRVPEPTNGSSRPTRLSNNIKEGTAASEWVQRCPRGRTGWKHDSIVFPSISSSTTTISGPLARSCPVPRR